MARDSFTFFFALQKHLNICVNSNNKTFTYILVYIRHFKMFQNKKWVRINEINCSNEKHSMWLYSLGIWYFCTSKGWNFYKISWYILKQSSKSKFHTCMHGKNKKQNAVAGFSIRNYTYQINLRSAFVHTKKLYMLTRRVLGTLRNLKCECGQMLVTSSKRAESSQWSCLLQYSIVVFCFALTVRLRW